MQLVILIHLNWANKMEDENHKNPDNWKLGIFYFNPEDKRMFVFKRIPYMGITINFANPFSGFVILVFILLIVFASR